MPTGRSEQGDGALKAGFARYRREIMVVLCLKAAALALLYGLFFASGDRPAVTAGMVARHLLAPAGSGPGDEVNHDR